ncbi:MAG TPA: hypothetical protein PK177_23285 [Burkholderiaceae bacterium]|nr:hypothetical protein [Burkholderiaceae bacterium]
MKLGRIFTNTVVALFLAASLAFTSLTSAQSLTDFGENKVVDALIRGQTPAFPSTWHIGLDTVACNDAAGGTEVSGGSYQRAQVAASLANWAGTQGPGHDGRQQR